jgi:hypothetical protein
MMKVLLVTLLLLPVSASAHLDGEAIIDNGYRVELGQDRQSLALNENTSFSLAIESLEGERVRESKAWVRLSLGDQVIFSSTDMQTTDGTIDFSVTFLESGQYELLARVDDINAEQQASAEFVLEVPEVQEEISQETKQPVSSLLAIFLSLSIFTLLVGIVIGKRV